MNRSIQDKLTNLRKLMQERGIDAYLVPRTDEYQNEFVAPYAERLKYLTNFTGSAGLAVILQDKAALFTDARYTEQAAGQCDPTLFQTFDTANQSPTNWLAENAKDLVIGYDPWLHTPTQIEKHEEKGLTLKPLDKNLIDQIWSNQPDRPQNPVIQFPNETAGRTSDEKITLIQKTITEAGAEKMILTLPDSIAWLLNIRGSDIECTPIVLTYALVENGEVTKLGLNEILSVISDLKGKVALDFKTAPIAIKNALQNPIDLKDPCIAPKAIKSPQEQEAIRKAHMADGVALVKFLHWFETQSGLTEMDVVKKLEEFRAEHPAYKEHSFPTIAGFASNGAIIHYRPTPKTNKTIEGDNLLLIDSGGQYGAGDIWGTTDITRTIAVGEPSREMKENFTHVLKGHIALATAKFTDTTTGKDLDDITRAPLLVANINYTHGTGHGVGCYLAVHEEAANISPKGEDIMKRGMLVSNEPGYYKSGNYGIRIENLILAQENGAFETVTLCPIDQKLIIPEGLNDSEKQWLNNYHKGVREKLLPFLEGAQQKWLAEHTKPLD